MDHSAPLLEASWHTLPPIGGIGASSGPNKKSRKFQKRFLGFAWARKSLEAVSGIFLNLWGPCWSQIGFIFVIWVPICMPRAPIWDQFWPQNIPDNSRNGFWNFPGPEKSRSRFCNSIEILEPILDANWFYFGNLGPDLDALGTNLVTFLAWHCTAAGSSCCGRPQPFIFCASCEACLCFVWGVSAVCLGASSGAVPVHTVEGPRSSHQEDILDGGRLSDDRLHSTRTQDLFLFFISIGCCR